MGLRTYVGFLDGRIHGWLPKIKQVELKLVFSSFLFS